MVMVAVEQAYRYLRPSSVEFPADGRPEVNLATSGGTTGAGIAVSPTFFRGFLAHPEQAATCLLAVARVARTRFYMPPGMVAAILRAADPVVTSNGDRLRFESFSACCGVHIRFDILPGSLDSPAIDVGTTNVDFNPPMREALARVGGLDPIHMEVGQDVTVTTLDSKVVEKKVPLPERWLKGFAEVQLAAAHMDVGLEISAVEARRFLSALPRKSAPAGCSWVVGGSRGARLTTSASAGALPLAGPERLRLFEPVVRFATQMRAYTFDGSTASAWELQLEDARLTITLSPEVRRGFSGEGGVLDDLSDEQAGDDADLLAVLLTWEPKLDVARLAAGAGISTDRVQRALAHLGASGRVGFDLAERAFFHRELPYDPAALAAMHPRLRDARALLDSGAVSLRPDGSAIVASGTVEYVVRTVGEEDRCTCPWWGRHGGTRGPCKHALAVSIARSKLPG